MEEIITENQVQGKKKNGGRAVSILLPIFSFLAVLLWRSYDWVQSQWSELTMDEIIFELTAPLEGTGNNMIEDYMLRALLPALLFAALVILLVVLFRKKNHYRLIARLCTAAAAVMIVSILVLFAKKVQLIDYIKNRNTVSDFIEKNYADPAETKLTFPEKKRNVIQIFLESMETTFTDEANGGAFSTDVIPELTALAKENEDFSGSSDLLNGGISMPGTTWTIGAIFGMTSGLPLNINIERNSMSAMTSFFPQITTLGDILQDQGYRQVFVLGSDATFGGRRLYLQQHGDFEFRDYVYAKEQGIIASNYKVWWGMEDEITFNLAKETLTELAAGDQPFNLTLLTVDTHFSDGYVCRLCGNEHDEQYSNVYSCSSRQVKELIDWIQSQDWYENTTIVLTGDHPTMDADYCSDVPDTYTRRTYTSYINSAVEVADPDRRREFSTFDNFPTTLAAMGVEIEGEKLGLGTNLFSNVDTLSEQFGVDTVKSEVSKKTDFIEKLEQLDPETEAKVEKYGNVRIRSTTYDMKHGWISISTDDFDIPEDEPVKYIRLKIWVIKGGQQIRRWIQTKPLTDGGYYTTFDPLKDLDGYPTIRYQFVIKFKDGTSYNLGPEGTLRNLPGHTFYEDEGTGDLNAMDMIGEDEEM
ncbi:MAG: sulfatase-like hydrolase/transferase [Lachnospiraceae bacterium]|nr:sulfatase-like hydrolase/transferase [Lachnospiraceae bacterium]